MSAALGMKPINQVHIQDVNALQHCRYSKKLFIIWIDQNLMLPLENQDHDKQLRELFVDKYQGFNNIKDALNFIKQIKNHEFIIICSGQIAYQFLKDTQDQEIIIYCGDKTKHGKLFLENKRVQVMIDQRFGDVISEIQERIQYNESLQKLDQIFNPKNIEISLEQVISDITKLISKKFYSGFLHSCIKNKKNDLQRDITVFESLLYFYSRPDIYDKINQCFSACRFEDVKYIFQCLLQGFQRSNTQIKAKLYRGLNLNEQNYLIILKSLEESKRKGNSLFWNALSSTSTNRKVAIKFASSYCKERSIVFEIKLNKKDPHPHYQIDDFLSYYQNENEVLLFPLFEFQVVKITSKKCKETSVKYTKVTINQLKDSFSQIFHNHKKHNYWMNNIRNQIKPYFDSISKFHFKRYHYIVTNENYLSAHDQFNQLKQEQLNFSKQATKSIIEQVIPFMDLDRFEQFDQQLTEVCQFELQNEFSKHIQIFFTEIQNKFNLRGSEIKIQNINQALVKVYNILEKNVQLYYVESEIRLFEFLKWLLWVVSMVIFPNVKISLYIVLFIVPKLWRAAKTCLRIYYYQNATKDQKIEKIANIIVNLSVQILQDVAKDLKYLYPFLSLVLQKICSQIDNKYLSINLQVVMKNENIKKIKDAILADPGYNPRCFWNQVNEEINSFILIAFEKNKIFWLVPNIPQDVREIQENCGLGIRLQNNLDFVYIGPETLWDATFLILGVAEKYIEEEEVLQKLENNQLQIIQQSSISYVF